MAMNAGNKPASLPQALYEAELLSEHELHAPALGYLHQQIVFAKLQSIGAEYGNDAIAKAKLERFVQRLSAHCRERAEYYQQLADLLQIDC